TVADFLEGVDALVELAVAQPRLRLAALGQLFLGEGHGLAHEADDVAAEALAMPGADGLHLREILVRLRLRLRGVDDRVVAEDLEGRAVGRAREAVAEAVQRAHDGERAPVEA